MLPYACHITKQIEDVLVVNDINTFTEISYGRPILISLKYDLCYGRENNMTYQQLSKDFNLHFVKKNQSYQMIDTFPFTMKWEDIIKAVSIKFLLWHKDNSKGFY